MAAETRQVQRVVALNISLNYIVLLVHKASRHVDGECKPNMKTHVLDGGRVDLDAGGVEQQSDDVFVAAVRGEVQRRHSRLVAQHAQHADPGRRVGLHRRWYVRQQFSNGV